MEDMYLAALMERLGLGGREMTASGHSKDFVLKVAQSSRLLSSCEARTIPVVDVLFADFQPGDGLP